MALESEADELFYGGAAGGGKTDLLLGLAGTQQWRSIIFRRVFPSLRGIVERSREIYNSGNASHSKDSYNEQLHMWRLGSGRLVEFGSIQYEKDKEAYRGRPHDFDGWDEVTEVSETQFRFVNTWNRTTRKGQRVRVVATGNPPSSSEGEWVLRYWAPWLDRNYANPAKPGELRWFARIDDKDVEVENGKAFERKGETIRPRSRTFIPARLHDNPILEASGYGSVLQGLPEPLRSQLLYGDFSIRANDNEWQVIPTAWVEMAIERGRQRAMPETMMSAMGIDCVWGGNDKMVLSPRYDNWFAPLEKTPGAQVPDGRAAIRIIKTSLLKHGAATIEETTEGRKLVSNVPLQIDAVGYGADTYTQARMAVVDENARSNGEVKQSLQARAINFAESASGRDRSGRFGFINLRARMYWKFREALDPVNGEGIALPDDSELKADLTAPRYSIQSNGIKVEPKADIKIRLGRSPDCGDAVVQAYGGAVPYGAALIGYAAMPVPVEE